jgi:class 3 adenylate cyclase/DNA-binding SARP family transcriptional activator/pimeloyl-ACP methyl ester carboxylesterase
LGIEFAILGPLEATRNDTPIVLGGPRQRGLLALLLVHANEVMSAERLIDELWGLDAPAGAPHSLQVCVSGLRKAIEPERDQGAPARVLVTQRPGYVVRVGVEELDSLRFERFVAEGRQALSEEDPAGAVKRLGHALDLWRGPALADFAYEAFAQAEAARLEEIRVSALEDRIQAELALGRHSELIGELEVVARANPLRERLWAHRMLALYRAGRQAEALRTFQELRVRLGDELGIAPSADLVALEEAMVLQKPELDWAASAPPLARPRLVVRAGVTAPPATMPETRYARSGDLSIAYQVVGDGPQDVVFVQGSVSHVELGWETAPFSAIYRRLSGFSRMITFDKRGTGLSDRGAELPTLEERMDDVRAVMDAAECERAAVVGMSEGGPMAMLFAATYPERVSALVLWATFARLTWAPDYPDGMEAQACEWFCDQIKENWGEGQAFRWISTQDAPEDEATLRHLARFERNAATPTMAAALNRFGVRTDARHVLGAISAPTLVVHRSGDPLTPVVNAHYVAEHIRGARLAEFPGDFHLSGIGNDEDALDEIEEFLTGAPPEPEMDRVLKTVLFTDIVGSTERAVQVGDQRWHELLDTHDTAVRRELERFHGQEIKTIGDGFLACFDGPERAIRCAARIADQARTVGLEVRAGLHTGECEARGDDLGGIAVHIAARVAALAQPNEVLVSRTVTDLVVGSRLEFADRGEYELKGVPGMWRLFAVERC